MDTAFDGDGDGEVIDAGFCLQRWWCVAEVRAATASVIRRQEAPFGDPRSVTKSTAAEASGVELRRDRALDFTVRVEESAEGSRASRCGAYA